MASPSSSEMAETSAKVDAVGKDTLQSVLRNSGKSLGIIKDERMALQHNIFRKVHDINQTFTDYWVAQAKSLPTLVGNAAHNGDGDKWQIKFATQESANAKAAAAKQMELWSQIEGMVKEAKDRDDKFWATWQKSLEHLAASDVSAQQSTSSMSISRRGKDSHHEQLRRKERPRRATARKPAPQGPTALNIDRAGLHIAKPSKTDFTRASTFSNPPDPAKSGRGVANNDNSYLPDSSTCSSTPAPTSITAKVRRTKTTSGHEKKERQPRKAAAKGSGKSSTVTNLKPIKRRGLPDNPHPVTDPVPGQLYQAYYHSADLKERGWYMGTVLPWKSSAWADETMIDFSMRDMDLLSEWPDCCKPGFQTKEVFSDGKPEEFKELTGIQKWMPGFEDGGPRVMDRKFLFLFFEDRPKRLGCLDINPTEPMALIKFNPVAGEPVPIDWVDARHLRANIAENQPVWGSLTAEKYRNKQDHVARLRQQAHAASNASKCRERFEAQAGIFDKDSLVSGAQQATTAGRTEGRPTGTRKEESLAKNEPPFRCSLNSATHVQTHASRQQNTAMPSIPQTNPPQRDQGIVFSSALSPVQMDIDEAYEEPPTCTRRAIGKRSLSNDDEYDEGLGMDYDLNLKRSAARMSRQQTPTLEGMPPYKLPRLDDYDMRGLSLGGSVPRSP